MEKHTQFGLGTANLVCTWLSLLEPAWLSHICTISFIRIFRGLCFIEVKVLPTAETFPDCLPLEVTLPHHLILSFCKILFLPTL